MVLVSTGWLHHGLPCFVDYWSLKSPSILTERQPWGTKSQGEILLPYVKSHKWTSGWVLRMHQRLDNQMTAFSPAEHQGACGMGSGCCPVIQADTAWGQHPVIWDGDAQGCIANAV